MPGLSCAGLKIACWKISAELSEHINKMFRSTNTQAVVIGYTPLNIQIIIIAFYKIFCEKTLHRSEPK